MHIVVIEDHEDSAEWLRTYLEYRDHRVVVLYDGSRAAQVVAETKPGLVLVDLMLPDTDGLQLMREMQIAVPGTPIVVMTGHASVTRAVDAMQGGAMSFLEKPIDSARLLQVLERAEGRLAKVAEVGTGGTDEDEVEEIAQFGELLTRSAALRKVFDLAMAVAPTDAHVLIAGENGTGKELIADAIHANSHRSHRPFVKINCAAIPSELIESELFGYKRGAFTGAVSDRVGLFEMARGGTLLLDEIGDMPPHLQAKLLRVLQDRRARPLGSQRDVELDFRLICATNCDLQEAIHQGKFRQDLFFRINTITVRVPPLRDRPEDITLLAEHFCAKFAEAYDRALSISPEAMELLVNHAWRGNVRELEHAIERAAILAQGDTVEPENLPETLRVQSSDSGLQATVPRLQTLAAIEKWAIQRTLEHTRGNKRAAAAILGVYRPTLYNKLRKYGIGDIADLPRRDRTPL